MCFVWIWEQPAIISLCSINSLLVTTETESVYCAVRAQSWYINWNSLSLETVKWTGVSLVTVGRGSIARTKLTSLFTVFVLIHTIRCLFSKEQSFRSCAWWPPLRRDSLSTQKTEAANTSEALAPAKPGGQSWNKGEGHIKDVRNMLLLCRN